MSRDSVTDKLQKKSCFVQVASVLITASLFCVLFCGCSEDDGARQNAGSSSAQDANNAISMPPKVPADQNLTEGSVSTTSNLKAAQLSCNKKCSSVFELGIRIKNVFVSAHPRTAFSLRVTRTSLEPPLGS